MNKKNNQTTIIDVKFDEEFKSELWIIGYKIKKSRKTQISVEKLVKNIATFSVILKCYFPFYKIKFCFSAGLLYFSFIPSMLKVYQLKRGFEGVPLK